MPIKHKKEYDRDFYAWAIHNAQLLRQGKLSEVDIKNVAEEIESMGKSEKRELINRLAILMAHLLKWQYQPGNRGNSWKYTIKEQRSCLSRLIEESPSLKHELEKRLGEAYEDACYIALSETGLNEDAFPKTSPFSLKQVLNQDFFPKE
ncbi:MAG TPA: DUF29 domain-containing protein [Gammaproteobacteria bacterium]|nr:DUF29 domain-containing protein [Gammaproteobacteria bacterium]